jgi:xylulokinase
VGTSYLIGVDAGVSFVKAGVYDVRGNPKSTVVKKASGEYPRPGVFLQKNADYLAAVTDALKEAVVSAGIEKNAVEAVGVSTALGGATGVDRDWNVVFDWSIVTDTRYYPYVKEMQEAAGGRILELSGTNFPIFAPKLLWWRKEYPDLCRKVRKFMFLCGYLVGTLCDIPIDDAFVDRTFLQISSIADIERGTWSEDICREFGIETDRLPHIVDSYSIAGKLSSRFAEACGLNAGTPFIAGAGDKPAGSLGAGLVVPGVLIDESASFGALSLCVDSYTPDVAFKTLENMPSPIRGHYFPCFFLFGSGVTHAWFRDNFGHEEIALAAESDKSAFDYLDEKACEVPAGSDGLLALGLLGGRGYPSDPDIRGLWLGHTWSHRKEHFYRSLLESFAYEYGYVFRVMKHTYPDMAFDQVRVIGGGARSDLWNQIKSDVMGLRYTKLNRDDFALLGDILLAGHAMGIYDDLQEAAQRFVVTTKTYEPRDEAHRYYQRYVECYEDIFDKVRDIFVHIKNIECMKDTGG